MRVVIVGDGKVGFTLAQLLTKEGHDIVMIDSNRDVLRPISESLDVMVVHGNGASLNVQKQANVGGAHLLIAATSKDEVNLLCCIIARKLGCQHTIARMRDPEYAEQLYFLREELGLSMVINPESAAAKEIYRLIQLPSFIKRDSFAKGRAEIVEIVLKPGNVLIGKRLSEVHSVVRARVLVCAIERGGEVTIPDGTFKLAEGDKLYVTASSQHLVTLIKSLDIGLRKIKNTMIIGGSRIAYYLASMLLESGISVTIIEQKTERCAQLAELLPKALIIRGDGTDKATLMSEHIDKMDAVVTLTNIDEENLLVSMFANFLQIPKVITKINRTEYNDVLRNMAIDCMVSPKLLCANDIVRYVRALQNKSGGSMIALHHLVDTRVEAVEFRVTSDTLHLGQTLAQIRLKPNILIACISRLGTIIIPGGGDTIELDDTLVIVTTSGSMILNLNDIFVEGS